MITVEPLAACCVTKARMKSWAAVLGATRSPFRAPSSHLCARRQPPSPKDPHFGPTPDPARPGTQPHLSMALASMATTS
jgi:hypothetical protein